MNQTEMCHKFSLELQLQLKNLRQHPILSLIVEDRNHSFLAVWYGFIIWSQINLIKRLQLEFSHENIPWTPLQTSPMRGVVATVSDLLDGGKTMSIRQGLFRLYLSTLAENKIDVSVINHFINLINSNINIQTALNQIHLPSPLVKYILFTNNLAQNGRVVEVIGCLMSTWEELFEQVSTVLCFKKHLKKRNSLSVRCVRSISTFHILIKRISATYSQVLQRYGTDESILLNNATIANIQKISLYDELYSLLKQNDKEPFQKLKSLSYPTTFISENYLSNSPHLTQLKHSFQRTGYVKFPMFLKKTVFENIASDIKNMYKKRFRKNFIMPEFKTDRKMSVLSGKEIVQHSESISNLYSSNELRNWISLFVGSPVFPIFDEDEFLVANFLDGQNDTHGWHLDDPQYALIIIIEAPTFDEGGHIEYISEWKNIAIQENFSSTTDVNQGVDICAKKKAISKDYLIKGDCYLLNAGDVLHRVAPLTKRGTRIALNLAFDDRRYRIFGQSARRLYA